MKKKVLAILMATAMTVTMAAPFQVMADSEDDDYTIAVVVKGNTNGWFIRMEEGIKKFAEETGINAYMTGPSDTDSAQQIQVLQDVVSQNPDAICVVPIDPAACETVLAEAQEKGITVICHEGSSVEHCDYDVEAFDNAGYGAFIMDNLAELMGEEGEYITMVGYLTSASHNEWADGAVARAEEAYPNMTLAAEERLESENSAETAYEVAKQYLKTNPNIKGFTGSSSDDAPGIARAISELGLSDSVFVVGTGMPNECRELLKAGSLKTITLWDPADAGYAMCELALKTLKGEEITNGTDLGITGYDNLVVSEDNEKILMGDASITITADNVDDYDF
jgi:simple sugar transport system substrate-binding protein